MIHILLVDDHEMLIEGIKSFFSNDTDIHIAGTANDGNVAFRTLHNKNIDVLITDLNMPKYNGLDLIKKVRKHYPAIKIIALTMYFEHNLIKELEKLNVNGYVHKNYGKEKLKDVIIRIFNGENYVTETATQLLEDYDFSPSFSENEIKDDFAKRYILTPRELEILILIAHNKTSEEISRQLKISKDTVGTHRKRIMKKTGSSSILDIYKLALKHQLLNLDD